MFSKSKRFDSSKPLSGKPSGFAGNGNQNGKGKSKRQQMPRMVRQVAPVNSYSSRPRLQSPSITSTKNSKLVCHDEFIGDINGSVAFTNTQFNVNPGLASTFPWLCLESVGWERYRFRKLQFYCTTQAATTATGAVILAPDYDSGDAAPGSQIILMDYKDRVDGPPWKIDPLVCNLNPAQMTASYKSHFIRFGTLPANEDVQTYDVANFNVGTVGQAGTTAVMKLHVRYECEFLEPQLPPLGNPFQAAVTIKGTAGLSNAAQFGTSQTIINVGSLVTTVAANVLSISGLVIGAEYAFNYALQGTTLVVGTPTTTGFAVATNNVEAANAGGTQLLEFVTYVATATSGTITLTSTAATVTLSDTTFVPITTGSGF